MKPEDVAESHQTLPVGFEVWEQDYMHSYIIYYSNVSTWLGARVSHFNYACVVDGSLGD